MQQAFSIIEQSECLELLYRRARIFSLERLNPVGFKGICSYTWDTYDPPYPLDSCPTSAANISDFDKKGKIVREKYDALRNQLMESKGVDLDKANRIIEQYIKYLIPIVAEPWEVSLFQACSHLYRDTSCRNAITTIELNGKSCDSIMRIKFFFSELFKTFRTAPGCPVESHIQAIEGDRMNDLFNRSNAIRLKRTFRVDSIPIDAITTICFRGKIYWERNSCNGN